MPSNSDFKQTIAKTFDEKSKLVAEREAMKYERLLQTEVDRLKRDHMADMDELRRRHDKGVWVYKEEIKRLEIIRQENLSIILQKEAEIRFLQEKIKNDERMKHTQIEHGKMLTTVCKHDSDIRPGLEHA